MSRRRREGGFTLLELIIAMVVLALAVTGLLKLISTHERLLSGLEGWCRGDPVYYVVPTDEPLDGLLAAPPTLAKTQRARPSVDPTRGKPFRVRVLSRERALDPPRAAAVVELVER